MLSIIHASVSRELGLYLFDFTLLITPCELSKYGGRVFYYVCWCSYRVIGSVMRMRMKWRISIWRRILVAVLPTVPIHFFFIWYIGPKFDIIPSVPATTFATVNNQYNQKKSNKNSNTNANDKTDIRPVTAAVIILIWFIIVTAIIVVLTVWRWQWVISIACIVCWRCCRLVLVLSAVGELEENWDVRNICL